jgi:hypothetical protein
MKWAAAMSSDGEYFEIASQQLQERMNDKVMYDSTRKINTKKCTVIIQPNL